MTSIEITPLEVIDRAVPSREKWQAYQTDPGEGQKKLSWMAVLSQKVPMVAAFPGSALAMIALSPRLGVDIFSAFEQKVISQMQHDQAETRIIQSMAELAVSVGKFNEFMAICQTEGLVQFCSEDLPGVKIDKLTDGMTRLLQARTVLAQERTSVAIAEVPAIKAESRLAIVQTEEKWAKRLSEPLAATKEGIKGGLEIIKTIATKNLETGGEITVTFLREGGKVISQAAGVLAVMPPALIGYGAELLGNVPAAIPPATLGSAGMFLGMILSTSEGIYAFTEASNLLGLAPNPKFWISALTYGVEGFAAGCVFSFAIAIAFRRRDRGIR